LEENKTTAPKNKKGLALESQSLVFFVLNLDLRNII
jgi:hypothetical protein